jgi:hypothetical protein
MKPKYMINLILMGSICLCIVTSCSKDKDTQAKTSNNELTIAFIEKYISAWNETDSIKRIAILEEVFSVDGMHQSAFDGSSGLAGLSREIGRSKSRFQGYTYSSDNHIVMKNYGFWIWRMFDTNKNLFVWGYDFGELNEEGKFEKVIGFANP